MEQLNCCGLVCPEPVIRCKKLLSSAQPAVLEVQVDNIAASENVARFLGRNGYSVETTKVSETLWTLKATKQAGATSETAPEAACVVNPAIGKTVVLITTETLGRGDDTLGTALMGNFLATLPELGQELWRVILLNGGVKLAVNPGKALDSLKKLEEDGVEIFVCGTCLNHYGLLEAKQVGITTNMLDIVTALGLASKVIRP